MIAMRERLNWDKIGAAASAVCAVHCLLTGVALGLLSVVGLGFVGTTTADLIFLGIAITVGVAAFVHGVRKHHSYKPAVIFALGLAFVVLGHFVFKHEHKAGETAVHLVDRLSTIFSVLGGICFVLFHVVNLKLQHTCGCSHCRTGQ